MGLLDSARGAVSGLFGGSGAGGDAGRAGAALLHNYHKKAKKQLKPYGNLVNEALPGLELGATPEGYFAKAEAMQPFAHELLGPVIDEKNRDLRSMLGASNTRRSGMAARAAADIEQTPINFLLQLSEMMEGREMGMMQAGMGAKKTLGNTGMGMASGRADAIGGGMLADAQSDAAAMQNLINLGTTGIGMYQAGMFGGTPATLAGLDRIDNTNPGGGGVVGSPYVDWGP